ncbi:MAG: hypothetical protein ACFE0O_08280 [Opitutales bacterium]
MSPKKLLSLIVGLLLGLPLGAAIQISFTFQPTLQSGVDTFGIGGSSWTMFYGITDASYSSTGFVNAASTKLTISGSNSLDGTYFPVEKNTGTFIITPRGGGGIDAILGASGVGGNPTFDLNNGSVIATVSGWQAIDQFPVLGINPGNQPVQTSDYGGLTPGVIFSIGGNAFSAVSAPVVATIPEPAAVGALLGLAALGLARHQRHRHGHLPVTLDL